MDARLQALLDKRDIEELAIAFARAADRHDHEAMRQLYHPDALDDHGAFFKGLAMDFIDQLPSIQAPMLILQHHVTTHNIKLDGHYAEGEVYTLAFHQVATEEEPLDLLIGGRYFDKYEKREGAWKFAHRAVVADWTKVNEPSQVNLKHPLVQGSHIGQPGEADPSFAFFSLFKWGEP
ncbi:MAG: nuclear transport factor 2 family protein [Pseudomonadota bacterium]